MKPEDISLLNLPSRPALAPNGDVVAAVTRPDIEADRYVGSLHLIQADAASREITYGPKDSAPVISPDGHTVVFLRAPESGPGQLFAIDLRGGEPRRLASHPLGAGTPVFSPDGARIAYLAAVPEVGRYGTQDGVGAEAEPPRPVTQMSYRRDGKGFLLDKPEQVFVLDLVDAAEPVQLTNEPGITGGPAWLDDGRVGYLRTVVPDRPQTEVAAVPSSRPATEPGELPVGELVLRAAGTGTQLTVAGGALYYLGVEFEDIDNAGRTAGLWTAAVSGGEPRRLTDPEIEVDTTTGPVVLDGLVFVAVLDRGRTSLRAVPVDADRALLEELPEVIAGDRVVTSFTVAVLADGLTVAATVATPSSPGELVTVAVTANGRPTGGEQVRSDWAGPLRTAGLADLTEITATAPDGYPVHGFLVKPPGEGPHPVLLVVHGGPHAAYGWGLFDEAQVYAAAGYAVVLPNPRGSSGYGHQHGRTVLGRLGTVDADDVLALLDAALELPDCDGERVGVMGGSYGGFMTSWLASHAPERFTAAISERAVNAWDSFAGSSDIGYFFAENYVGPDRESQWKSSPLAYADDITLPLLIIHSEHDWRCPIEQGQRLYVALKRRGAETEMLLFPSEGHELSRSGRPRHRVQRFEAILEWWGRYLPLTG
ncbi:dipeptidyl aminopeptidase/acylaminoacyl peptidase [Nakamurella sp. UYEF19]|uniref:S9 family peptidase n=1 Tax=Nakamurella sp. UYEF19 TaxID=1756392 RepID=UPI003397E65C